MCSCFDIFLKYQCDFRQALNAKHCLVFVIEKPKKATCKGKKFVALLRDLSKTYDCLPHISLFQN